MKPLAHRLPILLGAVFLAAGAMAPAETAKEDAALSGMRETLRNHIRHSPAIVDICVFEQEWLPPSEAFPKGRLIQRAVVTHSHHGAVPVGTQLEYTHYVEDPSPVFKRFTSTVPGKLRTFFFDPADAKEIEGTRKIEGDGHWGFDRLDSRFAGLFAEERKPHLERSPTEE